MRPRLLFILPKVLKWGCLVGVVALVLVVLFKKDYTEFSGEQGVYHVTVVGPSSWDYARSLTVSIYDRETKAYIVENADFGGSHRPDLVFRLYQDADLIAVAEAQGRLVFIVDRETHQILWSTAMESHGNPNSEQQAFIDRVVTAINFR